MLCRKRILAVDDRTGTGTGKKGETESGHSIRWQAVAIGLVGDVERSEHGEETHDGECGRDGAEGIVKATGQACRVRRLRDAINVARL